MKSKLAYSAVVGALLILAVMVRVWDPAPIVRARFLVFDMLQKLEPRQYNPDLPVRIVEIDDESIAAIGQWPWSRSVFVKMIETLKAKGAAVVAFDLVLPEPERDSILELTSRLPDDPAVNGLIARLKALPTNDQLLARAIKGQATVMGVMAVSQATDRKPDPHASFAHAGDDPRLFVPTYDGILASLPILQGAALGSGALNWVPDFDQIVRRVPLVVAVGETLYPALSVEILRVVQNTSTVIVRSSNSSNDVAFGRQTGISRIRVGEIDIPTDKSGQIWIRFTPHDKRRFISARDVIEGKVSGDDVAGRIVLVGATASGLLDIRSTPLDAAVPGVEIHAQAIEQMLLGEHLRRLDFSQGIELAVFLIGGVLLAVLIYTTGATLGAIGGAIPSIGVIVGSYFAYVNYGLLIDPGYPITILTLIFIVGTVFSYILTERERNQVRSAFSHYMAPALIEQLVREPDRLKLGGETRELTLLFSDVRGFTSIAETFKANPEGLTDLMNKLLSPLSRAILERKGVIDKYIGDAIMAFWNAPIDDPDHPKNACNAALAMLASLDDLNNERRLQAEESGEVFKPIRVGIGINTGVGVVGNMGSDMRFDYSVLGDVVNLASRLEALTAHYGVPILASKIVVERGAQDLACIELDNVQVKGRDSSEPIYGIFGGGEFANQAAFAELKNSFAQFLKDYRARSWQTALEHIEAIRKLDADGRLTVLMVLYEERIHAFIENPPSEEWSGEWRMDQK